MGYSEDMDDVGQGKMISSAPTKGDMGCVWPKGSKSPMVTAKENVMTGNKGVCTINNE